MNQNNPKNPTIEDLLHKSGLLKHWQFKEGIYVWKEAPELTDAKLSREFVRETVRKHRKIYREWVDELKSRNEDRLTC